MANMKVGFFERRAMGSWKNRLTKVQGAVITHFAKNPPVDTPKAKSGALAGVGTPEPVGESVKA